MAMRGTRSASSLTFGTLCGLLGAITGPAAYAQSVETPTLKSGDSWIYRSTTEKSANNGWNQSTDEITVDRATPTTIYYSTKQSGSTQAAKQAIAGPDWSRIRDVNGKETVVNRPVVFPLAVGKNWDVEYKEEHPNKAHKSEHFNSHCSVVGKEAVEVPAGKFDAYKIECEGKWIAELDAAQTVVQAARTSPNNIAMATNVQRTAATSASGRLYKAFWYVPKIKRWVKSVEEYYTSNGSRNERTATELESFKVAD